MGILDSFKKEKVTTKVCVEVFKGKLEKAAIVDSTKKEFSENDKLIESFFIVEGADEKLLAMAKDMLTFDVNLSEDFKLSYLGFVTTEKNIFKLVAIVTEGFEEELENLLAEKNYIIRIQK